MININDIMHFVSMALELLIIVASVFGMVVCYKKAFRAGTSFFILILVWKCYQMFVPGFVSKLLLQRTMKGLLNSFTMGQLIWLFDWVGKLILLSAFIVLIYGIHKEIFNKKKPLQ